MVLVIAGGGLYPGHFTRELVDVLGSADMVIVETYTMPWSGWLVDEVRRYAGGGVVVATRSMLEEESHRLLKEAVERDIVIVTAGDPLIATTHRSLISEASRMGVKYRVIHGVSGVCSAKADSGLDYYKYGRTVTIPGPWRGVKAYSVLMYTYSNMCTGLHTLLLLDVDERGNQLSPKDAAIILLNLEEEAGISVLSKSRILIVWNSGMENVLVEAYKLNELSTLETTPKGIASLVVPGEVSPIEAEHLELTYNIKLDLSQHKQLLPEACNALNKLKE